MKAQGTSYPAKLKDTARLLFEAANGEATTYTDPDHCPCLLTDSCQPIEALLKLK